MVHRRGWGEFWGPLLLLRFHRDNPARWSQREERAACLERNVPLPSGARLLDLGCGDGILDICLARRGFRVTAVDRLGAVLDVARQEPDAGLVEFRTEDIRQGTYPLASFDAVLMFGVVGFLGRRDDEALMVGARSWLRAGGRLVLDCLRAPDELSGGSNTRLDDGELQIRWTYDRAQRLQTMLPEYHTDAGDIIELDEPYDLAKAPHVGFIRYLYSMEELAAMGRHAGFDMTTLEIPWKADHYLMVGRSRGA